MVTPDILGVGLGCWDHVGTSFGLKIRHMLQVIRQSSLAMQIWFFPSSLVISDQEIRLNLTNLSNFLVENRQYSNSSGNILRYHLADWPIFSADLGDHSDYCHKIDWRLGTYDKLYYLSNPDNPDNQMYLIS